MSLNSIVKVLRTAPQSQLDVAMRLHIQDKWSSPPKALEVLEVLDYCIHGSLGSPAAVMTLQVLYDECCKAEKTTHEVVVQGAAWRK